MKASYVFAIAMGGLLAISAQAQQAPEVITLTVGPSVMKCNTTQVNSQTNENCDQVSGAPGQNVSIELNSCDNEDSFSSCTGTWTYTTAVDGIQFTTTVSVTKGISTTNSTPATYIVVGSVSDSSGMSNHMAISILTNGNTVTDSVVVPGNSIPSPADGNATLMASVYFGPAVSASTTTPPAPNSLVDSLVKKALNNLFKH